MSLNSIFFRKYDFFTMKELFDSYAEILKNAFEESIWNKIFLISIGIIIVIFTVNYFLNKFTSFNIFDEIEIRFSLLPIFATLIILPFGRLIKTIPIAERFFEHLFIILIATFAIDLIIAVIISIIENIF